MEFLLNEYRKPGKKFMGAFVGILVERRGIDTICQTMTSTIPTKGWEQKPTKSICKVWRKKSLKPFRNICRPFQKPQLPMRWKKTHL